MNYRTTPRFDLIYSQITVGTTFNLCTNLTGMKYCPSSLINSQNHVPLTLSTTNIQVESTLWHFMVVHTRNRRIWAEIDKYDGARPYPVISFQDSSHDQLTALNWDSTADECCSSSSPCNPHHTDCWHDGEPQPEHDLIPNNTFCFWAPEHNIRLRFQRCQCSRS